MKNAILPSVSSQLCIYGNSEPMSDIPLQIDSKINVYGSSFCTNAEVYEYGNCSHLRNEGLSIPPQPSIIYQPGQSSLMTIERLDYPQFGDQGYLTTGSSFDNIPQQQLSVSNRLPVPDHQIELQAKNARKRSVESDWMTNKKKVVCFQEQRQHQVKEDLREMIQTQRVPVRRSQKLSDRITALQKLVSPYGKTDTASVLQEATISIKALQDQIQNLLRTSNVSYTSTTPLDLQKSGEKQLDLGSRGLCLVPLSFTQEIGKRSPN